MKKSRIKKVCAIVIIVCIALIAAALYLNCPAPTPSFRFLDGREPTSARGELHDGLTIIIYSFEADFNDICASAHSELLALGYDRITFQPNMPSIRRYRLRGEHGITEIRILDKQKYRVYSTPKQSEYSSPDRLEAHYADGWVSVNVTQTRLPSRLEMMFLRLKYKVRSWFS